MKRMLVLALGAIGLVVALALAYGTRAQDERYVARPLFGVSPDEAGQVAINLTRARYKVQNGSPSVLFARPVTSVELERLLDSAKAFSVAQSPC